MEDMETFSHPDTVRRYGEEKSELFEEILSHLRIFCHLYCRILGSCIGKVTSIGSSRNTMGKYLCRPCRGYSIDAEAKDGKFVEEG
jgi:hypothetical protein